MTTPSMDSDKTLAETIRATLAEVVKQLAEDIPDDDVVCVARNRIFNALAERGVDIYTLQQEPMR